MANFQVNLNLDNKTVTDLQEGGYLLYGFKGLDGPPKATPVVWFSTDQYSDGDQIIWQEQYGGYTSRTTPVAPKAVIVASSSAPMKLGQLMTIGEGGVATVTNDQDAGVLEIHNTTDTKFTCGVTVVDPVTNHANPICAFELLPGALEEFLPIEKIFLMFATNKVNTGTVVEQSFDQGILIDMTGQKTPVDVTFTSPRRRSGGVDSLAEGTMDTAYTLNIACSGPTVRALVAEGSSLVAFSAVQGSDGSALPLVWLVTTTFGETFPVSWSATYGAYASTTPLTPGRIVQMSTSAPITPGQLFTVQAGPLGSVTGGGATGMIAIANAATTGWICGIQQIVNGTLAPVCAYPLHGLNRQTILPRPQVVLLFTTAPTRVGEVWSRGLPHGSILLLDMTSQTSASVTYDIDTGWSWPDTQLGAKTIPEEQVVSTLIQPSPPPFRRRKLQENTIK
jgi:hypothetical protein